MNYYDMKILCSECGHEVTIKADAIRRRWETQEKDENNPLPEVINNDNLLQREPHQFKLGDWVKCPDGKGKITNISAGQGKTLIDVVGKSFESCYWEDELEPRLKRKEIREKIDEIILIGEHSLTSAVAETMVDLAKQLREEI